MAGPRLSLSVTLCVILVSEITTQSTGPSSLLDYIQDLANCYQMPEDSCPYQDVTLWYFNNNNAHTEGILVNLTNTPNLPILQGAPWKIIFHGFSCSKDLTPNEELRPAYFQRGQYNILSADMRRPLNNGPFYAVCYPSAARNIFFIGRCFASFLAGLIQAKVLPPAESLHFVGHSLGAHIAGNTASELRKLGMGTVLRISGLDPAGPLLMQPTTESYKILDASDATVVDVHHTSGGEWYSKGQHHRMGSVDIYYNGGLRQPKCEETELMGCSHHKVVLYFAESIFPLPPLYNKFYGFNPISPYPMLMGEDMQLNTVGILYVTTSGDSPFALGPKPPTTQVPSTASTQLPSTASTQLPLVTRNLSFSN